MLGKKKRIFLDYASTTPVDPNVFAEMKPWFTGRFHNPSALYEEGLTAQRAIENARTEVATLIGARAKEIVFTGSGTESINLALLGLFESCRKNFESRGKIPHIITSAIEHPAIIESCREIENRGGRVSYITPQENGIIDPRKIREALCAETILVTIMYANNEIGTIQPISEIAKILRNYRAQEKSFYPFFHTDASQTANYIDISVQKSGVDMLTLDGSKIYGPKGVGILYKKEIVHLMPTVFGGGQEKGLRSGTENVPAIVGMAAALRIAVKMKEKESKRVLKLRDYCLSELKKISPQISVNGDWRDRLPNNINICVPKHDAEFMVIQCDAHGLALASVSSCKNLSEKTTSYVIEALPERAHCASSSLRITLGRQTTKKDIDTLIFVMKKYVL